jgi:hypothetical protein
VREVIRCLNNMPIPLTPVNSHMILS